MESGIFWGSLGVSPDSVRTVRTSYFSRRNYTAYSENHYWIRPLEESNKNQRPLEVGSERSTRV
jgi:hypothetical protein